MEAKTFVLPNEILPANAEIAVNWPIANGMETHPRTYTVQSGIRLPFPLNTEKLTHKKI